MSDKSIKVTDRRMFTAEGDLREEFEHLRHAPPPEPIAAPEPPAPAAATPAASPDKAEKPLKVDKLGEPAPEILDLIDLLAQHASIYLSQIGMVGGGGGASAENLELARLHIDLLAVLKEKTAGNLTSRESAVLDDALAKLRFAFIERRG